MTRIITLAEVKEAALPYAASDRTNPKAHPDDSTTLCVYTAQDGSHCIAGQILADLKVPLPGPRMKLTGETAPVNERSVRSLWRWLQDRHGVILDEEAVQALAAAQHRADRSEPWKTALKSLL